MTLRERLENADNATRLEFILSVIHGYTIMARDDDLHPDERAMINNRIHYLAGHALGLARGDSPNRWRIKGIVEHSSPLPPSLRKHAMAVLKKLDPGSSPG